MGSALLKTIVTIGMIQIASVLFSLVRTKVLAVLLGPAGIGTLSVVDQVVQVVAYVSSFSLPFAAVKFLSRSHSRGAGDFREIYGGLLRLLLSLAIAGTVIGLVVTLSFPSMLGSNLETYRVYLIPAFLAIPAMTLHGFFGSTLASAQRSRASACVALAAAIGSAAAAYVGVSIGGIGGLYWFNLVSVVVIALGLSYYLHRKLGLPLLTQGGGMIRAIRANPDVIPYSAILYATSFSYSASLLIARYTVLSRFGEAEAGLLQAAISVSAAIGLVIGPMNGLYLTPILNRDIAKAAKVSAALEFQMKLIMVVCVPAMLIVLFPEWPLRLLYSSAFVPVGATLFLFVIAQVVLLLAGVFHAILIGLDDLTAYGVISVLGYVVVAGGSWLIGPRFGVIGVGIALLAANGGVFILDLIRLRSTHGLSAPSRLYATIGFAVTALAITGLTASHVSTASPMIIVAKIALYSAFAAIMILLTSRREFCHVINSGRSLIATAGGRRVSANAVDSIRVDV